MGCNFDNLNATSCRLSRTGFWIVHILGAIFLVLLGMRLAIKRMALPLIAYRLYKILR